MPYKRGDVVLVLFPDSNLRTAKRRPALVIQSDNLETGLRQTIVAMITSNMSRDHPSSSTSPISSKRPRTSSAPNTGPELGGLVLNRQFQLTSRQVRPL